MAGIKPQEKVKKVWSPEFAYAIGLLVTDGNLSKDRRHINFTSKDIDLIVTFKKCLGLQNTISRKGNGASKARRYFQVQFGDILFYRFLSQLGLTPHKSKSIGPLNIPDQYFFDFLRGSFDGDGTIYAYWDPRWRSSYMFYLKFASASKLYLQWLQETIYRLCCIKGRIKLSSRCHELVFAKSGTRMLFEKMFYARDIPYLRRKFVKIQNIFKIDNTHNNAQVEELEDSQA